jgi:hypothetical protein
MFRIEKGRTLRTRRGALALEHLEGRELLSSLPAQPVSVKPPPGTTPPIVVQPPGPGNTAPPTHLPPGPSI